MANPTIPPRGPRGNSGDPAASNPRAHEGIRSPSMLLFEFAKLEQHVSLHADSSRPVLGCSNSSPLSGNTAL